MPAAKELDPGLLSESVALYKRGTGDDGYGNTETTWSEQFRCRASYRHLRGGETVMDGRLAGRHTQIITVWASSQSRQIATGWKLTDTRTGVDYNIRDVTLNTDRATIDLLCERGVAV